MWGRGLAGRLRSSRSSTWYHKGPGGGLCGLVAREQSPLAARPAPAHPQYVRSIIISNPNPELKPQPKPEPNPEPKPEPNPKSRP